MTPTQRLVWIREGIAQEAVYKALEDSASTLKRSDKFWTRRVGPWVVKSSEFAGCLDVFKRTLFCERYRRAWRAAQHLEAHGVAVPSPIAYLETRRWGLIFGNTLIVTLLGNATNVEVHAAQMHHFLARQAEVESFFQNLAEAVNALTRSGAYHADLSGKNIFSEDGTSFSFLDLDGVVLTEPYTDVRRLKNHIQLYDSFCDLYGDDVLGPFIARMTPPEADKALWMDRVRDGQKARRDRHTRRTGGGR